MTSRYALLLSGLLLSNAAGAYPPPPVDPSLPRSPIEPAVQQMRRAMLDPDLNSLTFHNMDQLFTTRVVGRSGPVWHVATRRSRARFHVYLRRQDLHARAISRADLHQRVC